jgi:hypothetical protein
MKKKIKNGQVQESSCGLPGEETPQGMDALSAAEINRLGHNWKDNEGLAGLLTGKAPGMTGNINGLRRRMDNVLCTVLHTSVLKPK